MSKPKRKSPIWVSVPKKCLALWLIWSYVTEPNARATPRRAVQCANPSVCVQPLETGERAPYAGALVPYDLAAELVISASVAQTLHQIEVNRLLARHVVELDSLRQLASATKTADEAKIGTLSAQLEAQSSWTRSPLLWLGVGVLSCLVVAGTAKVVLR